MGEVLSNVSTSAAAAARLSALSTLRHDVGAMCCPVLEFFRELCAEATCTGSKSIGKSYKSSGYNRNNSQWFVAMTTSHGCVLSPIRMPSPKSAPLPNVGCGSSG